MDTIYVVMSLVFCTIVSIVNITWVGQIGWAFLFERAPVNGSTYDFIVVGSGSAGSVVTGRLAEAGHSVLLVEAGGEPHPLMTIPFFAPLFWDTPYVYRYFTERNSKAHKAMSERRAVYPRGKMLGGTSMLNWMLYVRGHSKDFDEWESWGNTGWGYEDVLPFFKKSESYNLAKENDEYHGKDGPLSVEGISYIFPFGSIIQEAFKQAGFPLGDVNGKSENGGMFDPVQVTTKNGWRAGTFKSFVEPLTGNSKVKLDVAKYSYAKKLLLDESSNSVTGIEIENFGKTYTYSVEKEIIVSAGAFGSPQLLMLSGIGPKEHLEEFGIPLRKDLPVGQNHQDHAATLFPFQTENPSYKKDPFMTLQPSVMEEFLANGTGPLSNVGIGSAGVFHTAQNRDKTRPDSQVFGFAHGLGLDNGAIMGETFNMEQSTFDKTFFGDENERLDMADIVIISSLSRPKSRGSVRLSGTSIHDLPEIEINCLAHPDDMAAAVSSLEKINSLKDTPAFKDAGFKPLPPSAFDCPQAKPASKEYFECVASMYTSPLFHSTGTCRMGPPSEKNSVVNPDLKVKSFDNLRVADASVMPRVVGANTHAATVMIGEKAADMILKEWRQRESGPSRREEKTNQERKEEL